MRTASLCLLASVLAACSSTTSSSQGPGTSSADAAAQVDVPQADQAPASDGQTSSTASTTVTAAETRTMSGTSTSTGSGSGTGTDTATPSATGTGTGSASSTGSRSGTGAGSITHTISTTTTGTSTRTGSTTGSGTGTGVASGTGSSSGTGSVTATGTGSSTSGSLWKPSSTPSISWDWQIGASSDTAIIPPAGSQMIDVDGFNVSASKVAALHAAGIKVVCYLDVGSFEPGRPDSADYPAALKLSEDPDWPSEWFLDTRDVFKTGSVLAGILSKRFQMCKDKGFDAVEPDNLDNWAANSKILTEQDQIDFDGWVADSVHALGISVALKNCPELVTKLDRTNQRLVDKFDFELDEQCQEYSECGSFTEFTKAGKAIFDVEYKTGLTLNCSQFSSLAINALKKDLDLVGAGDSGYLRLTCP